MNWKNWLIAFVLGAALLLSGCGAQELYRNLDEEQANEMVAVLQNAQVQAHKVAGEKDKWAVTVDEPNFARAVSVLKANGLPRQQFDSLGSVFKKEGFGSSPTEERARYIHARQQELTRTVSEIDGVVTAQVQLTMPEVDALTKEGAPAAASVFVKYRPGFNVQSRSADIKNLVANGVEGLEYNRVNVVMFPAQAMTPVASPGLHIAGMNPLLFLVPIALLLAATAAIMWFRKRKETQVTTAIVPRTRAHPAE